jgi:integrase
MAGAEKLSAAKVAKAKRPGRYGDGRGLWLHIGPTGGKSWVLRFMRDGVAREMGLGPLPEIGLAAARDRARAARRLILDGVDPIESRHAARADAKAEATRGVTFEAAAKQYIAAHEAGWRNPVHRKQWQSTLATYAFPVLGGLPVGRIDTGLVCAVLEPIWTQKPETAKRLRGRIEAVLDWARARYGQGEPLNPARWRGHLDKLFAPPRKVRAVKHHAALPYAALPSFMDELRRLQSVSARALEFTILTAARTSEAIGARWSELDLAAKLWTIPGVRMKAGRDHRVPLPDRAVEILKSMPREGDGKGFVFPGAKARLPLSNMAMAELLKGMNGNGYTVHGFRSTFRDWAAERTSYPREIAEAALAHMLKDKTEAAYRRGDLFEKRRKLMQAWADYCASKPSVSSSKVVAIGARG